MNRPEVDQGISVAQPLKEYEALKFELASLARAALAALPQPRDPRIEREYTDLLVRLAEDQFNLVVVGEFNRGKTSLMNAVLGLDRLPTGVVPLTSVITVVRHGSRECALVEYEQSGLRQEISIAELSAYVTQEGNPGNQKRIRTVEVQLPAEILRRGFRFVDTPGLGSAISENTATTENFLPQADALVFVTSCDAPLGELEVEHLRASCRRVRKTFLVINKADLVAGNQREQIREFVYARIAREGLEGFSVYELSARDGLRAKLEENDSTLQASGLLQFERDLINFLVTDKSRDFLVQNCDRLMHMVLEANSADRTVVSDIAALRARAVGQDPVQAAHDAIEVANTRAIRRACPVCQSATRAVADFLAKYQYAISHNREIQRQHAAAHGFCPLHTWQYERLASPRGVCSAYPPVLAAISSELRRPDLHRAINEVQPARESCPACGVQQQAERAMTKRIADSAAEFSGVVCLPHLRRLLELIGESLAEAIVGRHAAVLERIAEDMQRFALKHDGLKRTLISEEEKQAHYHGLALLAGDRRLATSPESEIWL